jgi:hypothetical protein
MFWALGIKWSWPWTSGRALYSALPERSGPFYWSLEDQPRYFKSQVLVQGYKMGSKEWIWKNKWNWKLFAIYTIDFIYGRFSKTFNRKKLESIAWDVREMILNENFSPKSNIGSQWSAKQGQNWKFSALNPFGTPRCLTPLYLKNLSVIFLIFFHLFSFFSDVQLWPLIFSNNIKGFWKSAIHEINFINFK